MSDEDRIPLYERHTWVEEELNPWYEWANAYGPCQTHYSTDDEFNALPGFYASHYLWPLLNFETDSVHYYGYVDD